MTFASRPAVRRAPLSRGLRGPLAGRGPRCGRHRRNGPVHAGAQQPARLPGRRRGVKTRPPAGAPGAPHRPRTPSLSHPSAPARAEPRTASSPAGDPARRRWTDGCMT